MKLISLKEFQSVSLLSDSALLWLLTNNALPISLDPNNVIMINIEETDVTRLLAFVQKEKSQNQSEHFNLIIEEAGRIIRDNFEDIVEEAISKASAK